MSSKDAMYGLVFLICVISGTQTLAFIIADYLGGGGGFLFIVYTGGAIGVAGWLAAKHAALEPLLREKQKSLEEQNRAFEIKRQIDETLASLLDAREESIRARDCAIQRYESAIKRQGKTTDRIEREATDREDRRGKRTEEEDAEFAGKPNEWLDGGLK